MSQSMRWPKSPYWVGWGSGYKKVVVFSWQGTTVYVQSMFGYSCEYSPLNYPCGDLAWICQYFDIKPVYTVFQRMHFCQGWWLEAACLTACLCSSMRGLWLICNFILYSVICSPPLQYFLDLTFASWSTLAPACSSSSTTWSWPSWLAICSAVLSSCDPRQK